ncbi:putative virulence factor [Zwartia vadi]|uniref:putative virulence factor n=1 Tax=Zwartia vadi TaxID=3058168 RepID=UPI0025B3E097|nr:putative virulence factor [Zwartia vadi]MDN3986525.1 putative virulence factor [Zwartia vadi]
MTDLTDKLSQGWLTIHQESGRAIEWVGRVRGNARSVDNEADSLVTKLRRIRNQAKSLAVASRLPSTVGFFGLSQAGKSYLISALAAGSDGKLETEVDGKRLDFLSHINPPGGGKEATGLVTRFSFKAKPGPTGYPLELKLFEEIELVKILSNSYFNDFNFEKVGQAVDLTMARQQLSILETKRLAQRVPGVSEDDMVSLWDYLRESYGESIRVLEGEFLPRAVELAPYLSLTDRATLFSCLWRQSPALTQTFLMLSQTLHSLGYPSRVFAPIDAIVRPTGQGGALSQADSIMNVDMLERLGRPEDLNIQVLPVCEGEVKTAQTLTLAQLAALTAEMIFPLVNSPHQKVFSEVDLLDFPGYRGRLGLESLSDISAAQAREKSGNPVAQLLLRGKVAYLFERYTDSQEMNVLVVCTASHKQSDVTEVGPVLTEWIRKTQGDQPEDRSKRDPGLIWAVTMFDMKITDSLSKDEDMLHSVWNNLIKMTMLERFGGYQWMQDWANGAAFNNTFLVRKPRMPVAFLDMENGQEKCVTPAVENQLHLMKQTFEGAELIQSHVAEPESAWHAMMALNDGGVERLSQYLAKVSIRQIKLDRIAEQMDALLHDLVDNRLGRWFHQDGVGEVEAKRKIAQSVVTALRPRITLLAELQEKLRLSDAVLQDLYMGADEVVPEPQDVSEKQVTSALNLGDDPFGLDDVLDIFGDQPASSPKPNTAANKPASGDARFAQTVVREWIEHLRDIPSQSGLLTYFGLSKEAMEMLCDELITAATRMDLQGQILQAVSGHEQVGTKRERLVDRQVMAARTSMSDFIAWLGYINVPLSDRSDSRINAGHKLFEPPSRIPKGKLPGIGSEAFDHTRVFMGDWLVGFAQMVLDNAGHDGGREIKPEQNAELGALIAKLNAAKVNHP